MFVDEFYFHEKRGLPKWERIGHPLDTISVLAVFGYCLLVPFAESAVVLFFALALGSCLLITKDEWVHQREACPPFEAWLHSVLFILHPLVFFGAYSLWASGARNYLLIQSLIVSIFLGYQILRWNISWHRLSITRSTKPLANAGTRRKTTP
jgi:hypothetical protein